MLLISLVVCVAAAAEPPVVTLTARSERRGVFGGIQTSGRTPAAMVGGVAMPLEETVSIVFPPLEEDRYALPSGVLAVLPDGTHLSGVLAEAAAETITLRTAFLGAVKIPVERLLALVFPPAFATRAEFDAFLLAIDPEPPSDTLHNVEGGSIHGILDRIDGASVVMNTETLGILAFPFERIRAVVLAQMDPTAPPSGLRLGVRLADGTFLCGPLESAGKASVSLATSAGTLTARYADMRELSVDGGRWAFLCERPPDAREERTPFGGTVWRARSGANVMGGPLMVRGRRYRRGVGVHSYAKLTYRLEERYERFEALAALDDTAADERLDTRIGNVVFRVIVDGETRLDSGEVSWNDPPLPVSVDVRGAQALELEVDLGAAFHVRDRANWIEARLLRAAR